MGLQKRSDYVIKSERRGRGGIGRRKRSNEIR